MRRRSRGLDWPPELATFSEADWPPVAGECLGGYACRDRGYEADCVSLSGPCGHRFYAMLAAEYPGRDDLVAAHRRKDAWRRWHQARLAWLGPDHPWWLDEFVAGLSA